MFMSQKKVLVCLLLVSTFCGLFACQSTPIIERSKPLKQDPEIQAYFNHNQAQGADYRDPYRKIDRPGDNLEQLIIDQIQAAQSTIDVAVQEFRLPKIAQALVEKYQAGVRVRVILENTYNFSWAKLTQSEISALDKRDRDRYLDAIALIDQNQDGNLSPQEIASRDAIIILREGGVPLIDDTEDGSKGSGLMHHKFLVVDNKTVIVTSANFTTSDVHGDILNSQTRGNANNLLNIESTEAAKIFTDEFNLMWGDGPKGKSDSRFGLNKPLRPPQTLKVGSTSLTIQFSPNSQTLNWEQTSNGLIGKTLTNADQTVDLALFVFSEQPLADILQNRHQEGVAIRALIDPQFAFRSYSEGLDLLGVALSQDCKYEQANQPWTIPLETVGIPNLIRGDKLHHKFGLVDDATLITGSHNWSAAANHLNDETLLILENRTVLAHYKREFERLYAHARIGLSDRITQKVKRDAEACSDKIPQNELTTQDSKININQANQELLESLPGIGEKLAQEIIKEREIKPFQSLEDLQRVSGIGEKTVQKMENQVTW